MKTVYQTDAEGFFIGAVAADPSPLEPDVWLIPGGAVEEQPPALSDGQRARWVSGAWAVIDPPPPPEPEPEPTPEEILAAERAAVNAERDRRLVADFMFNGVAFQRDPTSLQRITGAATLAGFAMGAGAQPGNLRWANPDRDFLWIASDNTLVPMDAQTCFAFGQTAANVETNLLFKAKALRSMDPIPEDYTDDKWWV